MKNKKYSKIGIFFISMLFFQVLVVSGVLLKSFIAYEVLDKPKYLKTCIEMDYECVSYCDEVDDISYRGTKRNCAYGHDCCIEYDYTEASLTKLIKDDLKFWIPLTSLGVGIAFSAFITDYIWKKLMIKMIKRNGNK